MDLDVAAAQTAARAPTTGSGAPGCLCICSKFRVFIPHYLSPPRRSIQLVRSSTRLFYPKRSTLTPIQDFTDVRWAKRGRPKNWWCVSSESGFNGQLLAQQVEPSHAANVTTLPRMLAGAARSSSLGRKWRPRYFYWCRLICLLYLYSAFSSSTNPGLTETTNKSLGHNVRTGWPVWNNKHRSPLDGRMDISGSDK